MVSSANEPGLSDSSMEACQTVLSFAADPTRAEQSTRLVALITVATMVVELVVGYWTNSLSLLADGVHMATHAGALGLASLAYWFARSRRYAKNFTFGTGKVYALAGYTNAVGLALVAVVMTVESISRLVHPQVIRFAESLPIAVGGLLVNLVSALLLNPGGHDHDHGKASVPAAAHHDDDHDHPERDAHGHKLHGQDQHAQGHPDEHAHAGDATIPTKASHDHNLRAAYFHVLADAFTSVLAIAALTGGWLWGWTFLDPLMGIVGAVVILRWGARLCWDAGRQLLDVVPARDLVDQIRTALEQDSLARVTDLHVWELGPGRRSCVVALTASDPLETAHYRDLILKTAALDHLTVEVHKLNLAVTH